MARSEDTLRIDSQILRSIGSGGSGGSDFTSIATQMARRFYERNDRAIDRGLQRLRKAGKIRYLGGKDRIWELV